jgi:2-dehydro-3-deoxyglucarate aldolase/4-hydroxy-2-oxoheptanedioate aldolase
MNMIPPSIGTWLSTGSPVIAELAALSGFDWVLFDLEHGNESEASLPNQLRGLRGTRTRGIVRVGAPHADLMARVLDWGAHGIMVPHVNSAAEAELIMAQIETVEAVKRAAEIARTDGIDVLFVGPSDLQFDLQNHADSSVGDYQQCLRTVVSAAKGAGKAAGILVRDAADLPAHHDLGFTHIAVDLDIAILRKAYAKILNSIEQ